MNVFTTNSAGMEEEINNASVVFKPKGPRPKAKKKEEVMYEDVKLHSEPTEKHPDINAGPLPDKESEKRSCFKKLAYCFGIACVILSLEVGGLFVYIVSIHDVTSQLKSNQAALQEEKYNLNSHISSLTSEKENLTRNLGNVTDQLSVFKNLTKSQSLLKNEIRNLTTEKMDLTDQKRNLETKIQTLETQNLKLETEKKKLTEQIQNLEAEMIQFNTSRAQWSINAYCQQQDSPRTCKPCESSWLHSQSSCYEINDHDSAGQKNWEEAQKDCRGKGSDLVVVADDNEKETVSGNSWGSSGFRGYWIGLRAKDGKWKWVDGSDLANTSWMTEPATDGRCVISVHNGGWKSVSCDEKQQWFCEKAALSV
ncbi:C-type lectin domain family 4 member G-like isoform X2 [Melanotaenia boesemani]|uniref:C-type lectin domain family 4 member G-like isoform X2 n=2 Tax=Melanotaenia boesemani TaxID=1250792 RepID=UPI001C057A12|nr:C-type lectin domain family 4 member G-like isoform X2 [Melanotaenia boesemani]